MRPEIIVPRVARSRSATLDDASWSRVPVVSFSRAQDGGESSQATLARVAYDVDALLLRFDCDDRDVWATHTRRDAPLWEEEVVELFLAPGEADPREYFEIEVNPLGTIFDARVANPHGRRDTMVVDTSWNADGLVAAVARPSPQAWRADLVIPWTDLCAGPAPRVWRANLFRIERPRDGDAEFSCWVPTLADPPDFHRPAHFGRLILQECG